MRAEAIRRRLTESDDDDSDSDIQEEEGEQGAANGAEDCYRVPATGARVTLSNAKGLLFHYCSKLPSDKQVYPPLFPPPLFLLYVCLLDEEARIFTQPQDSA